MNQRDQMDQTDQITRQTGFILVVRSSEVLASHIVFPKPAKA